MSKKHNEELKKHESLLKQQHKETKKCLTETGEMLEVHDSNLNQIMKRLLLL